MAEFTFEIIETVTVLKQYAVSADSESDARAKAESGETDSEFFIRDLGVLNREIVS